MSLVIYRLSRKLNTKIKAGPLLVQPLGENPSADWSAHLVEGESSPHDVGFRLNDVLLSAMTGGLRRYLGHRGERANGVTFRAAMPVNLRQLDDMADLGNQFGLIFLSLPVGIEDRDRISLLTLDPADFHKAALLDPRAAELLLREYLSGEKRDVLSVIESPRVEEINERRAWYGCRWMVEVFHDIEKNGCLEEDRRFESAEAMESCLALLSVVAVRVF